MQRLLFILLSASVMMLFMNCSNKSLVTEKIQEASINIIPQPTSLEVNPGEFEIGKDFIVLVDENDLKVNAIGEFFADVLAKSTGFHVQIADRNGQELPNSLDLGLLDAGDGLGREGYELTVSPENIHLRAEAPAGLFYGIQTILQLLPPAIYSNKQQSVHWTIPCVEIRDVPRYSYRGMHLDVCRHFFPVEFIKKYIDLIALHKMNIFHWHLTEDQGWRIEIKKYPRLSEVSAYRDESPTGSAPGESAGRDGKRYGGFYTQEEIEEIVQYARERYVTIIPEIEMPGHSLAALAAYPELSCTGGPFKVGTRWGVYEDVYCAGNDRVFEFLEDVLTEVIGLFPGEYIHIGGDECPKIRWKACEKCQARIKNEGLKDEHELQSYFIRRIEKFLQSKGKRLIGWDEILEGGMAPEATVMSWRGIDGGIEAARQGHDVIMTPDSYLYFNRPQGDIENESLPTSSHLTLKKVYSYEPTPSELTQKQAEHILGAQANVWTEYIKTADRVEYMALSRMCALAEVVWSAKENRNWESFNRRLQTHLKRLDQLKVNYSRGSFKVAIKTKTNQETGNVLVCLESEQYKPAIHYTTDGSKPKLNSSLYKAPFPLDHTVTIKAGIFQDGKNKGKIAEQPIIIHKALGKTINMNSPFSSRYPAAGEDALIDGITGSADFSDGNWQGYQANDLDVIIDLGKVIPIEKISTGFIQNAESWIFMPLTVEYAVSVDDHDFETVAKFTNEISEYENGAIIHNFARTFSGVEARYIKVFAENRKTCPQGHPGAGDKAWLFVDEIIIE
jgi:hexosaminidase